MVQKIARAEVTPTIATVRPIREHPREPPTREITMQPADKRQATIRFAVLRPVRSTCHDQTIIAIEAKKYGTAEMRPTARLETTNSLTIAGRKIPMPYDP